MKEGIESLVNESKLCEEEKKLIEIVIIGGSLRIPLLQTTIEEYLKNIGNEIKINRTINMDEDISYGNSYYGLIKENKWEYNINSEEIEESINDIISIPQNEVETELRSLNCLLIRLKERKIKEENRLLLREMAKCIDCEMNELKNKIENENDNKSNIAEITNKIERMYNNNNCI